ncbi:DHA2 family efflux MFS transporter permease subunit [Rhodococcus sp. SORGH_AS_0301]|uniref:DHA2 family efflux MFS transporter permease subunit n=1 Tax=Rhodococcus sp. SORGH_AS_0301 TaxID=3041780 RepID=UPI0027D89AB9|nr:DHA2 family efflux MFS transporter permease subunit [Rhodococcus sp. SORGH_AS_0301]
MIVLATCCLSLLIVSMDATIVNVALPAIRTELGASVSQLQWTIDVYTLVLASLLLLSGTTADRVGRRRVFQIGLVSFAVGSLLCSLAPTAPVLILARMIQAIGGSMLNPVAMSIITQVFTGKAERARAIGMWGAVVGISMALGPMLGGLLIEISGWRSVFWINIPVCLAAFVLAAVFVPESRSPVVRAFDPVGQLLGVVMLASLVFGLIEGPSLGWSSPITLAVFALSLASFVAFVRYENRRVDPFIDLRFFRSIPFSSATIVAVCAFGGYGAFLFLMSLYLQEVRGFSAIGTGASFLPLALATLICSPLSGRMVARWGARPSMTIAGVVIAVAGLTLTRLSATTPVSALLVMFAIFGVGFGLVNAPITNAAVGGMPRDRAGAASAVASTSRQIGVSIGVALCGSLTTAGAAAGIDAGFAASTHTVWWALSAIGLIVAGLGLVSASRRATRTADDVAALFRTPEPARA